MAHINGVMNMYGACVKLAIDDFREVHKYHGKLEIERKRISNKNKIGPLLRKRLNLISVKLHNYDSAKFYLFSKRGLEDIINKSGLPLNISYIRRICLEEDSALKIQWKKNK